MCKAKAPNILTWIILPKNAGIGNKQLKTTLVFKSLSFENDTNELIEHINWSH